MLYLAQQGKRKLERRMRGKENAAYEFQEFATLYEAQDYAAMESGLKVSQAVLATAERARKDAGIVFGCDKQ